MELELLRKVAKAAKAVKNQWLSVMDYPIPHSEPLQAVVAVDGGFVWQLLR